MGKLVMQEVSKTFAGGHQAVRSVSLETGEGELVVVVGPSGCGKTTALRMIAGLEEVTSGRIELDGVLLNELDAGVRDVAMVFQNYALYPHLTVYGNLVFPLRERKVPKAEREERVREVARILGVEGQMDRKPAQLSGGQRQRVAMGRAIVRHPRLFLMDEPLSNLDAQLRVEMRTEIHAIQRRLAITTMYVTHDQVEAMTLGDRVVVMLDGVVQQIGPPGEVYDQPANLFVASFLGSPGMNLFAGQITQGGARPVVHIGEREINIDEMELTQQPAVRERVGSQVVVGIRPEALVLRGDAAPNRSLPGTVALTEALGSSVLAYFETAGVPNGNRPWDAGARSSPEPSRSGAVVRRNWAVARFGPGTKFPERSRLEVTLQPGAMRFFHPETGLAI